MLSLDDPKWAALKGAYRVPYDASVPLKELEAGRDTWQDLFNNLHHQADVDEASYAALPHLVRIASASAVRDWRCYALAATIEVERHNKKNPPVPSWVESSYKEAWQHLLHLSLHDLADSHDPVKVRSALAVVALAQSQIQLGALLICLDSSELAETADRYLEWSKNYA